MGLKITLERRLLINKVIERKNDDIEWKKAVSCICPEMSDADVLALSLEAKEIYMENLIEDQYVHSLS